FELFAGRRRITALERQQSPGELRAVEVERTRRVLPERDLAKVLHELHRLAGLELRRIVIVVELDLARIDAFGAAVETRRPRNDIGAFGITESARPDHMDEIERPVVLAGEICHHAAAE